ncbi:cytochrome P450 [Nemania abortiva]|nr:cytochrome P450 [Nemania abortiva]
MPNLFELRAMTKDYFKVYPNVVKHPTVTLCLVAVATYLLLEAIYSLLFHPLRKIPGPFFAKLGQSWRNHKYIRGTWHDDCLKLHEQYGNVVRIAPNEISFVDEQGLGNLYGHGKRVLKTNWYDTWTVPDMSVSFFAATDIKVHRHVRSRVSGAYSMTSMLSMEPLIQDVLNLNLTRLVGFADKGEVVQIDKWVNFFTFDIVGQLAMGSMIGFLEQGRDVNGIIQSVHDGFWIMSNMGYFPLQSYWINNSVSRFLIRHLGGRRLNAFNIFNDWVERQVDDRMRNGLRGARRDMLQHFIEAKDQNGNPVTKGDVVTEASNILGAGADTTAIGILAIIGNVISNPRVMRKLQQEIDQAHADLGLGKENRSFSFKELEKLPYLSAVITESTRLHPSIQYQLPRYVPKEGAQIGPYFIKEGAIAGISPRSMNRSKEIFGEDADMFRPERWIPQNSEEERIVKQQALLLTTFGMGSRSCVGKHLATVEMYKYTAQFFFNFEAEPARPERMWKIQTQWFSMQEDFPIKISRRSQSKY